LQLCLLAGFLLAASFPLCADHPQLILFGVFPYLPPARLEQVYAPVAADFSEAIGRQVQLRTRPTFLQFRKELKNETYDIIFVQPFAYVETAVPHGYRSISHPSIPLTAQFVTRTDSPVTALGDLKNEIVAAPPTKAAVSLLGLQTLLDHQLIPGEHIRITYQSSHAACLRQILIDKAAACITATAPLGIFKAKSGMNFRVVATSRPIPGSTYAVHKRVPEQIRDTLQKRIINWVNTTSGQRLLESISMPGFVSSVDKDYDSVRRLLEQSQEKTE